MTYEVVESSRMPYAWTVEAIDDDSEGEIYAAIFFGQRAKERAQEYADWKNGKGSATPGK